MVVILVEWKSINFMPFVRSVVGRPRWSLAAAGRDHALPPMLRAVRSQRGRLRRRKMIHPTARHVCLPTALATGDPWAGGGVGRRPPAACSHTRSTATTSPVPLPSSSKPMASGSPRPSYVRLQQQGEPHHSAFISSDHAAAM